MRKQETLLDWLMSLTGKVWGGETHHRRCAVRFGCRGALHQDCMRTSVEIKRCFYISKFCYPQQASLYSENLQTMTETEKTTSEPRQWALETSYLGKKYNTALGIYHVYIINCAIYNALMKDDEIISHLQRKRGRCEMNYSATALFYSIARIRLSLPINYTPYVFIQLNAGS